MHSSAADLITATVCCMESVIVCWQSCRLFRTQQRASLLEPGSSTTSLQFCVIFTGFQSGSVSVSSWLWWFTSACTVWHRPTWLTSALLSRLSSAGGSCGRRTAEHLLCQVQGPPLAGATSRCPVQQHGTDSRSNCGPRRFPLAHSQKKLKTHLFSCENLSRLLFIRRYTNEHIDWLIERQLFLILLLVVFRDMVYIIHTVDATVCLTSQSIVCWPCVCCECAANIDNGSYDERDIERVRTNDDYLKCFIRSFYYRSGGNMNVALEKLDTVLTFRKKIGLNGEWLTGSFHSPDVTADVVWQSQLYLSNVYHNNPK